MKVKKIIVKIKRINMNFQKKKKKKVVVAKKI